MNSFYVKGSEKDELPSITEESVLVLKTRGVPARQETTVDDTGKDPLIVAPLFGGNEALGVADVSSREECRCQPECMQSIAQDGKKQKYPCLCSEILRGISSPLDDQRECESSPAAPVWGVVMESDLGKPGPTPSEHLRCMMPPEGVLEPEQVEKTIRILIDFQDVFVGPDGKVGYNDEVTYKIETSGEPIKCHPRAKSQREK